MKKEIVINATTNEIRVALTEDGRLAEVFLEVADKESRIGSLYLGNVQRVVQGMNAAFVDIGESQHAFLHFSDVGNALDEFKELLEDSDKDDDEDDDDESLDGEVTKPAPEATAPARQKRPTRGDGDRRGDRDRRGKGTDRPPAEAGADDAESAGAEARPEGRPEGRRGTDRGRDEGRRGKDGRRDDRRRQEAPKDEHPTTPPVSDSESEAPADAVDQDARSDRDRRGGRGGRGRDDRRPSPPDRSEPAPAGEEDAEAQAPPREGDREPRDRRNDRRRDDRKRDDRRRDERPKDERRDHGQSDAKGDATETPEERPGRPGEHGERRGDERGGHDRRGDRRDDRRREGERPADGESDRQQQGRGRDDRRHDRRDADRRAEERPDHDEHDEENESIEGEAGGVPGEEGHRKKKRRRRGRRGRGRRGHGEGEGAIDGEHRTEAGGQGDGGAEPQSERRGEPRDDGRGGPREGRRDERRDDRREPRRDDRREARTGDGERREERGRDHGRRDERAGDQPSDRRREERPAEDATDRRRDDRRPDDRRRDDRRHDDQRRDDRREEGGREERVRDDRRRNDRPQEERRESAPEREPQPPAAERARPEAADQPEAPRGGDARRGGRGGRRDDRRRPATEAPQGDADAPRAERPAPDRVRAEPPAPAPAVSAPPSEASEAPAEKKPGRKTATKRAPRAKREEAATPAEAPAAAAVEAPAPKERRKKAAPKRDAEATATPEATPPAEKPAKAPRKKSAPRGGGKATDGEGENSSPVMDAKLPTFQTKRSGEVTIDLQKGQDVIVQVTRESFASKGVRVSTKVSLPGRFLVLLPLDPSIGVSRKVQQVKERRRLRRIAKSILPEGHGCIIRTNAQNKDAEVIRQDLMNLINTWRGVEEKLKATDKPGLLYRDQSIANTVMRDLFTPDISRVVIDNKSLHRQIREFVEWAAPQLADKVELYSGEKPIFDEFGIEKEIERIYQRRVWLPSGGYIILEQTEAMMVIDVNSGRYADQKEQELTSLRTNVEAARELARQIRLRDIGGLIIVDFIDLYDERNRKKVYDEVKKELRRDRAKSVVLPMTQFGLVQMTRQRIRAQVLHTITQPCSFCNGSGLVQSKSTVARRIERWLQRFRDGSKEFRLMLRANPAIIDYLVEGDEVSRLTKMMLKYFVRIKVVPDDALPVDSFQFHSVRQGLDVTDKFLKD